VGFHVRFPGQYLDGETGLHYNRHRYYDPGIGRYISADPIGQFSIKRRQLAGLFGTPGGAPISGADLAGANLFEYGFNDPVNIVDPTGLTPLWLEILKRLGKDVIGAKPVNESETIDTDGDRFPDYLDGLPNYPGCCYGPWVAPEGPAFPDRPPSSLPDSDGDGLPDLIDPTPDTPGWEAEPPPDADGCTENDGVGGQ